MKKIIFKCLFTLIIGSHACFASNTPAQVDELIQNNHEFSLSLYKQLEGNDNLVFSPYSIFSCLSMIYVGARESTATEIQKALSLGFTQNKTASLIAETNKLLAHKLDEENHFELSLANGLWVNKDSFVLSDFRHVLQDDFEAQVSEVDFSKGEEAMQIINEWTYNTTHGKIPKILEQDDIKPTTRLVLTNSLYFKGNWQTPFRIEHTKESPFYTTPTNSMIVRMMEQTATFPYYEDTLFQILALPFEGTNVKDGQMACLILLPKEGVAFADINRVLTPSALRTWIRALNPTYTHINLPRFELTQRYQLDKPLQAMGMQLAFTVKANLSGIDGYRDLMVNRVVHETFFHLDEAGVTAAAATAGSIGLTAFPDKKPAAFIANRPFLFMIVDLQSQLPLFMGKLSQPR